MKNLTTNAKIQTRSFLAGAMLLLLTVGVATAADDGWTTLGGDDKFTGFHQPTGDW